jgi:hypothetical protein
MNETVFEVLTSKKALIVAGEGEARLRQITSTGDMHLITIGKKVMYIYAIEAVASAGQSREAAIAAQRVPHLNAPVSLSASILKLSCVPWLFII